MPALVCEAPVQCGAVAPTELDPDWQLMNRLRSALNARGANWNLSQVAAALWRGLHGHLWNVVVLCFDIDDNHRANWNNAARIRLLPHDEIRVRRALGQCANELEALGFVTPAFDAATYKSSQYIYVEYRQ